MKLKHILPATLMIASLPVAPVLGQVDTGEVAAEILSNVADPSLTSTVTNAQPQVTLTSSKEGTALRGEIGLRVPGDWLLSLRVQAPVQDGQEEVDLASLDGLGDGATATLGLTRVFFSVKDPNAILAVCDEFNGTLSPRKPIDIKGGECKASRLETDGVQDHKDLVNRIRREVNGAFCDEVNKNGGNGTFLLQKDLQFTGSLPSAQFGDCDFFVENLRKKAAGGDPDAQKGVKKIDDDIESKLKMSCEDLNASLPEDWIDTSAHCQLSDLEAKKNGAQLRQKALQKIGLSTPKFFSLKVSASNQSFKIAKEETIDDTPTLTETDDSKINYSGSVSFGLLSKQGLYYGVNAIFKRLYQGAPTTQVCRPIPGKPGQSCSDLALEGPMRKDQEVFQAELRKFFTLNLGINAKVSYEAKQNVKSGDFILYFLRDADKGLNGGLDFGYRSDNKNLTIRAFIGMALHIVPVSEI